MRSSVLSSKQDSSAYTGSALCACLDPGPLQDSPGETSRLRATDPSPHAHEAPQSPGGPTCTAITDRTSTEMRLNSSKQPQAPVWARPL